MVVLKSLATTVVAISATKEGSDVVMSTRMCSGEREGRGWVEEDGANNKGT